MKHKMYGIRFLAASLAALALTGPAKAGQMVPFKGMASGVVTTVGPTSGQFVTTPVSGEGEASHLGHFTEYGVVTLDTSTGAATGPWILTTANGDMLFLDFAGGPGAAPNQGQGTFTVTGGTGRFTGATGGYIETITFSAPPGSSPSVTYTDVIVGTISSPGSNH